MLYDKRYREENRDEILERSKRYYEQNRDEILEHQRRYREQNRDEILEQIKHYQASPASFSTYAKQLDYADPVRQALSGEDILETRCTYCGRWFTPNAASVMSRIGALNEQGRGECRLYCSTQCKKACPTFNQIKYPRDHAKPSTSREVQPELRQMVFNRDEWACQRCGATVEGGATLHCHHITGVELNPIESADIDNCITFCKDCHKEVHKQPGCTYADLKRQACTDIFEK